MDPVKGFVGLGGDAGGGEVGLDGGDEGEVGVEGVGFVLGGGDVGDGGFAGGGVGGDEDAVEGGCPVGALFDYNLLERRDGEKGEIGGKRGIPS